MEGTDSMETMMRTSRLEVEGDTTTPGPTPPTAGGGGGAAAGAGAGDSTAAATAGSPRLPGPSGATRPRVRAVEVAITCNQAN